MNQATIFLLLAVVCWSVLGADSITKRAFGTNPANCRKVGGCPRRKLIRPAIQVHGKPKSCLEYLKKGASKSGVYTIYDNAGKSFSVFCDMDSEPGNAWTLVMSWSNKYRVVRQIRRYSFTQNGPVNKDAPNFFIHRQTLSRMYSIKSHSTHWRATCSYPTHGVDYRDYVRGNFRDFDIMTFTGHGECKNVDYINIRGRVGIHTTAKWWQVPNSYGLHTDSSARGCRFFAGVGSVHSEDNFGFYASINRKFRCTADDKSTTQWWFGGHL